MTKATNDRKKIKCILCEIRYGDSIQCDDAKCMNGFHVTCAQKAGLIYSWKIMEDMKRDQDTEYYLPIYCKRHLSSFNQKLYNIACKIEEESIRNLR